MDGWQVSNITEFREYKDFAYWLAPKHYNTFAETYQKALYQFYDGHTITPIGEPFIRENWFLMTGHYTSVMDFVKDYFGDFHTYWAVEKLASEFQDVPLRLILERMDYNLSNIAEITTQIEDFFWQSDAENCEFRGRIAERLANKGYDVIFNTNDRTITKINKMLRKWKA